MKMHIRESKRFHSRVNEDYYCGIHVDIFDDVFGAKVFLFELMEKDYHACVLLLAGKELFGLNEDELREVGRALEDYALSHQEDYLSLLSLALMRQYGLDEVADPWIVLRLKSRLTNIAPAGVMNLL